MAKPLLLSASRIKLLESCSWKYYSRYVLSLPKSTNSGAQRGTIVHKIFELLLNLRHEKHQRLIFLEEKLSASKPVERLVRRLMAKEGLGEKDNKDQDNYSLISSMIVFGLSHDFYLSGKELEVAETEIKINTPRFKLIGYIDKLARDKDGSLHIYDYKSSAGNEDDHSLQALTYALWAKKDRNTNSVVKFVFLRFPDDPEKEYRFTEQELDGFEEYLAYLYPKLIKFSEDDARSNFARHIEPPEKGFGGKLQCGFSYKKDQLKKDGKPYYACEYKFSFDYFVALNEAGEEIGSAKTQEELTNLDGCVSMRRRNYTGCPAWK